MKFNTKILHGKAGRNTPDGGTLPGISQVSAFSYDSAEHLEKVFGNKAPGFAYTRIGNPTVAAFEQRINELEGGVGAVACASGMAAITAALLNVLSAGAECGVRIQMKSYPFKRYSVSTESLSKLSSDAVLNTPGGRFDGLQSPLPPRHGRS